MKSNYYLDYLYWGGVFGIEFNIKAEMSHLYTIINVKGRGAALGAFIYYSAKWTLPNRCFCLIHFFVSINGMATENKIKVSNKKHQFG